MKKEGKILSQEDITFLSQLIESLEEAGLRLEQAYEEEDYEYFNKLKIFILKIQKKISEVVK